jgi:hypothetical protein
VLGYTLIHEMSHSQHPSRLLLSCLPWRGKVEAEGG